MNNKWMHLLVALFSIAAAAGVDARPDRGQRGEAMMDALGLSDEQRMHIEKLREAHREEMRALRMSGARPDPQAMERLFDVHQRQIAETLTPEQREQMERLRLERGHRRGGPERSMMGRRGDRRPRDPTMRGSGKPFAQLDLSEEQSVKLDALMESQHEEMQALVKEHREAMQALIRAHREAMESVLTKAQRAELEEIKDDAFYHRARRGPPR